MVLWFLDQFYCSYTKNYQLHAFWHVGTSLSILLGCLTLIQAIIYMWQFMMGFGLGVYVGTIYDCKPTVTFISTCLKNNIPKDALPKKKDDNQ